MIYAYSLDYRIHGYMLRTFGIDEICILEQISSALELGCFEGRFTRALAARYDTVTVVEESGAHIQVATKAAPSATFIQQTFEDVTLPTEFYDAVFLIHTLEHVEDPGLLLSRIREWLAPKGRLYVAVPNAFAASRQIAVEMGLIPHPWSVTNDELEMGHNRTYDLTYLRRTITDAGLTIMDSGGILFKPMSNGQMDKALEAGIIDDAYLEGAYKLGKRYPELCSSIYAVCTR